MNLEAQREAIRQNRKYRNCKPVALVDGWTGLEFLDPADRDADWVRKLHLSVPDLEQVAIESDADNALPGWARLVKKHILFVEWAIVVVIYFLFTFIIGPLLICGYSSFEEFEGAMSAMSMGEQMVVGAKLWVVPVAVFLLRNRIGYGLVRLCESAGRSHLGKVSDNEISLR